MSSPPQYKNVVIVGLGLSGTTAFESLSKSLPQTHRIVAISPIPGYWPIAALRASVVPGYESQTIAPLSNLVPSGSRHVVLEGVSVEQLKDHSVVLSDEPQHAEFGKEIEFDYCVVATGSSYPFPCRPPPKATAATISQEFQSLQQSIASSRRILILGGGPVGIEFAGEVADYYNGKVEGREKKEIVLVHGGERFIEDEGFKPKLGQSLYDQLVKLGVKVYLGEKAEVGDRETGKLSTEGGQQRFELKNAGETIESDFLFVAFGNKPNTELFESLDRTSIDPSTRRVQVSPTFQVERHSKIFAIGDITSIREAKLYAVAKNHGPVVAQNIVALIQAGEGKAYLKSYSPGSAMMAVSVGTGGGAGQMFGFTMGPWMISLAKSKSLFVSDFKKLYHATA